MLRILVSFIAIFVFANMIESFLILSSAASEINAKDVEEVRDNLVEVRLALQKGDLTEALQHADQWLVAVEPVHVINDEEFVVAAAIQVLKQAECRDGVSEPEEGLARVSDGLSHGAGLGLSGVAEEDEKV